MARYLGIVAGLALLASVAHAQSPTQTGGTGCSSPDLFANAPSPATIGSICTFTDSSVVAGDCLQGAPGGQQLCKWDGTNWRLIITGDPSGIVDTGPLPDCATATHVQLGDGSCVDPQIHTPVVESDPLSLHLDGSKTMTGNVNMGGNNVTGGGDGGFSGALSGGTLSITGRPATVAGEEICTKDGADCPSPAANEVDPGIQDVPTANSNNIGATLVHDTGDPGDADRVVAVVQGYPMGAEIGFPACAPGGDVINLAAVDSAAFMIFTCSAQGNSVLDAPTASTIPRYLTIANNSSTVQTVDGVDIAINDTQLWFWDTVGWKPLATVEVDPLSTYALLTLGLGESIVQSAPGGGSNANLKSINNADSEIAITSSGTEVLVGMVNPHFTTGDETDPSLPAGTITDLHIVVGNGSATNPRTKESIISTATLCRNDGTSCPDPAVNEADPDYNAARITVAANNVWVNGASTDPMGVAQAGMCSGGTNPGAVCTVPTGAECTGGGVCVGGTHIPVCTPSIDCPADLSGGASEFTRTAGTPDSLTPNDGNENISTGGIVEFGSSGGVGGIGTGAQLTSIAGNSRLVAEGGLGAAFFVNGADRFICATNGDCDATQALSVAGAPVCVDTGSGCASGSAETDPSLPAGIITTGHLLIGNGSASNPRLAESIVTSDTICRTDGTNCPGTNGIIDATLPPYNLDCSGVGGDGAANKIALDAAMAAAQDTEGGVVYIPTGICMMDAFTWLHGVPLVGGWAPDPQPGGPGTGFSARPPRLIYTCGTGTEDFITAEVTGDRFNYTYMEKLSLDGGVTCTDGTKARDIISFPEKTDHNSYIRDLELRGAERNGIYWQNGLTAFESENVRMSHIEGADYYVNFQAGAGGGNQQCGMLNISDWYFDNNGSGVNDGLLVIDASVISGISDSVRAFVNLDNGRAEMNAALNAERGLVTILSQSTDPIGFNPLTGYNINIDGLRMDGSDVTSMALIHQTLGSTPGTDVDAVTLSAQGVKLGTNRVAMTGRTLTQPVGPAYMSTVDVENGDAWSPYCQSDGTNCPAGGGSEWARTPGTPDVLTPNNGDENITVPGGLITLGSGAVEDTGSQVQIVAGVGDDAALVVDGTNSFTCLSTLDALGARCTSPVPLFVSSPGNAGNADSIIHELTTTAGGLQIGGSGDVIANEGNFRAIDGLGDGSNMYLDSDAGDARTQARAIDTTTILAWGLTRSLTPDAWAVNTGGAVPFPIRIATDGTELDLEGDWELNTSNICTVATTGSGLACDTDTTLPTQHKPVTFSVASPVAADSNQYIHRLWEAATLVSGICSTQGGGTVTAVIEWLQGTADLTPTAMTDTITCDDNGNTFTVSAPALGATQYVTFTVTAPVGQVDTVNINLDFTID